MLPRPMGTQRSTVCEAASGPRFKVAGSALSVMRSFRLLFVLVLVATVALAGCPDGGEDGGYARTGDADGGLELAESEPVGAQASSPAASNSSGFVPGSTNT